MAQQNCCCDFSFVEEWENDDEAPVETSWISPVTGDVRVMAMGGGAGGSGSNAGGWAGGGGGGGAKSIAVVSVVMGDEYNIYLPGFAYGGVGAGTPGDNAEDTILYDSDDVTPLVLGAGGKGGTVLAGVAGGAIADCIGDTAYRGGNGTAGFDSADYEFEYGNGCGGSAAGWLVDANGTDAGPLGAYSRTPSPDDPPHTDLGAGGASDASGFPESGWPYGGGGASGILGSQNGRGGKLQISYPA